MYLYNSPQYNYIKVTNMTGITNLIRFYSLIYGALLCGFSIFMMYPVYNSITYVQNIPNVHLSMPMDRIVMNLGLEISFFLSGLLLIITYFGLSRLKSYSRLTGIFGSCLILITTTIEWLFYSGNVTLNGFFIIAIMVIIPTTILIILITVFWNRLNLEAKVNSK